MIKRIKKVQNVAAVETFGLGNVVIENRALNVAAVDPASFRRFTPTDTAQLQDVWDRVAGGELSITPSLGRRFQDENGEIALGSAEDAPTIHIGAFVPQTIRIDAVVNEKWAEELDMELGNAVLLSTGERHPSPSASPCSGSSATRPRSRTSTSRPGWGSTPSAPRRPSSPAARPPTWSAPSTTR